MKFADYYRRKFPGVVTHAITWIYVNFMPNPFLRRQNGIMDMLEGMDTVAGGPFQGMHYGPFTADKALLPRLLGTYEKEVYPAIEEIVFAKPDVVVVAGAGEGFYAIGLARRLSNVRVIAFEISNWGRYLIKRHAKRNSVTEQIKILGNCTITSLNVALAGARRPVVVCDIEGGEDGVLDPHEIPSLKNCLILVELHPMYVDGIEDKIARRFAATHDIATMRMGSRPISDIPEKVRDLLPRTEALWAVDEVKLRGPIGIWMLLKPKTEWHGIDRSGP